MRGEPEEGAHTDERRLAAEDALRLSEERFRALTLYSGDIISLLDGEGKLIYNSPATERINGFTAEDLEGIDTFELIHPDDRERVGEVFGRVLGEAGSVHTVQYRYKTKDGRWIWMEAIASNQLDNPAVRGVVANSRDITARVEAEEERRRLEAQMLNVQKLESLGVLAGGVAHDFNNLLTVILGQATLILAEEDLDEIRESAGQIEAAARQAADLTQLLLAYAGKSHFSPATTSLTELVEGLHSLLAVAATSECRLSLELDRTVPAVDADARQLRQVLLNVVQNGAESITGEGEVRVAVFAMNIDESRLDACIARPNVSPGDRVVCLRVVDDGEGMDAETLKRIFDPFYSTKRTGRGLGLAAVLGIVRAHDAGLYVRSSSDGGTTFELYFPPSRVEPVPAAPSGDPLAWRSTGRVLVVDDEVGPAHVLCRLLERLGFDTVQVSSGFEAVRRCRDEAFEFDLAIIDMIMPRMDGAQTFAQLRELRPLAPVLFYSGYDDDIAESCLQHAATAFLRKPFTYPDLVSVVRRLLEAESIDG